MRASRPSWTAVSEGGPLPIEGSVRTGGHCSAWWPSGARQRPAAALHATAVPGGVFKIRINRLMVAARRATSRRRSATSPSSAFRRRSRRADGLGAGEPVPGDPGLADGQRFTSLEATQPDGLKFLCRIIDAIGSRGGCEIVRRLEACRGRAGATRRSGTLLAQGRAGHSREAGRGPQAGRWPGRRCGDRRLGGLSS